MVDVYHAGPSEDVAHPGGGGNRPGPAREYRYAHGWVGIFALHCHTTYIKPDKVFHKTHAERERFASPPPCSAVRQKVGDVI
jgi:hypothetical protein